MSSQLSSKTPISRTFGDTRSASAFGAMEVTFRTRQHFRGPRCLRTNDDDTGDDWRVFVDGGLDSVVVVVDGHDIGSAMLAPTLLNL